MNLLLTLTIWLLKRKNGACEGMYDYEEFDDTPHELNADGRCFGCRTAEVVTFLEYYKTL